MRRFNFSSKWVASSIGACCRLFSSDGRVSDEIEFSSKLRDITVLTGTPKPCSREGDWVCPFPLHAKLEDACRKLLQDRGWKEVEIKRELSELFAYHKGRSGAGQATSWTTVEEFQRTPWYRRYRPNDSSSHFISIEVFQIMEEALIPPSQRGDPYAHLRKRHLEDAYTTERYTKESAQHITRAKMARQTSGMEANKKYGGRADYLAWEKKYKEINPHKFIGPGEIYQAWKAHLDKVYETED